MLYAADIHIYREHSVRLLPGNQFFIIVVVHIAQEIPGGTCPLRHGVGLPLGVRPADRTLAVHPLVDGRQRRLSGSGRLIGLYLRQPQRKLFFRHRHIAALGTVNDRDGLAPVTLTGEYPVTQLVVDGGASNAFLLDDMGAFLLKDGRLHTVPLAGIDHDTRGLGVGFRHIFNLLPILGDNLDDWDSKLGGKLKVTVVVSRHTHDGSGTVISQYVVGQPDRHLLIVQRIDGIASREHTGLLLVLHPVYVGLHGRLVDVALHRFPGLVCSQFFRQGMLRRQHHEGGSIQGVRTGGVDRDLVLSSLHREIHFRAVGFADPVGLHFLNLLRPVQLVQVI